MGRVNNLTVGLSSNSGGNIGPRCNICIEQWRLIQKEDNGTKKWWCRGCGSFTPLEPTNNNGKYTSKYGSAVNKQPQIFIISQQKKKSRLDALPEADKSDVAAAFGSSSVRLIESRDVETPT